MVWVACGQPLHAFFKRQGLLIGHNISLSDISHGGILYTVFLTFQLLAVKLNSRSVSKKNKNKTKQKYTESV